MFHGRHNSSGSVVLDSVLIISKKLKKLIIIYAHKCCLIIPSPESLCFGSTPTFLYHTSSFLLEKKRGIWSFFFNRSTYLIVESVDKKPNCCCQIFITGEDMLLVGVGGPSGPCNEVTVKHEVYGKYIVNYRPTERGAFIVVVKWNDENVPGSPFHVLVHWK